jgi:hypothetical protein
MKEEVCIATLPIYPSQMIATPLGLRAIVLSGGGKLQRSFLLQYHNKAERSK